MDAFTTWQIRQGRIHSCEFEDPACFCLDDGFERHALEGPLRRIGSPATVRPGEYLLHEVQGTDEEAEELAAQGATSPLHGDSEVALTDGAREHDDGEDSESGCADSESEPAPAANDDDDDDGDDDDDDDEHPDDSSDDAGHTEDPEDLGDEQEAGQDGTVEEKEPASQAPINYCYCRQPDDGSTMVGCDSETCPFGWYHQDCIVWPTARLPDFWLCPECHPNGTRSEQRKAGRKTRRKYARPDEDAATTNLPQAPVRLAYTGEAATPQKVEVQVTSTRKRSREETDDDDDDAAGDDNDIDDDGDDDGAGLQNRRESIKRPRFGTPVWEVPRLTRGAKRPHYAISSDDDDEPDNEEGHSEYVERPAKRRARGAGKAPGKTARKGPVATAEEVDQASDSPVESIEPPVGHGTTGADADKDGEDASSSSASDEDDDNSSAGADGGQGATVAVGQAATVPRQRGTAWSLTEERLAIGIMAEILHQQEVTGDARWRAISEVLARDHGISRSAAAVKSHWNRVMQSRCGLDERERATSVGRRSRTAGLKKNKS